MLLCLFALCATIGLFISNTATAVLMAPIAIATAREMALSPYPFAMIIGIAASAAFMTPVSSPVNTLVLGPGVINSVISSVWGAVYCTGHDRQCDGGSLTIPILITRCP